MTIGRFVEVGALWVAKIVARWVSPEGGVYDFDIVFGNVFRVIAVLFVEAFFESIVHGVDGDFAIFVALHGVDIRFLDEENKQQKCHKAGNDDDF